MATLAEAKQWNKGDTITIDRPYMQYQAGQELVFLDFVEDRVHPNDSTVSFYAKGSSSEQPSGGFVYRFRRITAVEPDVPVVDKQDEIIELLKQIAENTKPDVAKQRTPVFTINSTNGSITVDGQLVTARNTEEVEMQDLTLRDEIQPYGRNTFRKVVSVKKNEGVVNVRYVARDGESSVMITGLPESKVTIKKR